MQNEFQLNDSQIKVYKAIKEFYKNHGYSPSIRELQKICGYKSTSSVHNHLKKLEKAGYIELNKNIPRAIRLL
ncbi:MAG: repressor LexA [Candidatus Petromonas sp.]|jgi:repressor LexA|nr:repressor LexA [Candidatus Petromonas sp.]